MSKQESGYRLKCFNAHGEKCAECGALETVQAHHRDGDRTNNDDANLLPLCKRHHRQLHRSGLNGWEDELKPVEERQHIDHSKTTFQFRYPREEWDEWKSTVPRTKSLNERIVELIKADTKGQIDEITAGMEDPRE